MKSPLPRMNPSVPSVYSVLGPRGRTDVATLAATLLLLAGTAAAQPSLEEALEGFDDVPAAESSEPGLDAVLEGFGDTPEVATDAPLQRRSPWELDGAFTLSTVYDVGESRNVAGTDWHGLNRLRGKLNLELDVELSERWETRLAGYGYHDLAYAANGRHHYTDAVLDELESELELGEAWLRGRLGPKTDIKLGRQIVVWGKSDNLRITDVLNPLDAREPGMTDIEDLRLPVGMLRLDHYMGDWGLSAMLIPELRFDKTPPYGSPYYPLAAPRAPEAVPADGLDDAEYALAANGIFSGWDLSLYWADVHQDQPYPAGGELRHPRNRMLGLAANLVQGNLLWKAEAARFEGVRLAGSDRDHARSDVLLGVEYSGLDEATLSFEVADRHLHDWQPASAAEEDLIQYALRYQGDFLHARLHLTALTTWTGSRGDGGGFTRLAAEYDLSDGIDITLGSVLYHGGDTTPFDAIADNDRVFADWRVSF